MKGPNLTTVMRRSRGMEPKPTADELEAVTAPARPVGRWNIVLTALVGALAAVVVWCTLHVSDLHEREQRAEDALAAAKERVPKLLSYRADHLQADLSQAGAQATGEFGRDYRRVLAEVVQPNSRKSQITNAATVKAAGVVRDDGDDVIVLVFLTQTTRSNDVATPQMSNSRVEVTMTRTGDEWLISGLEPV